MPTTTHEEEKDKKPQELDQKGEKRQPAPGDQGNKSQGNGHNDGGRREGDQKGKDQDKKGDSGPKDDDKKEEKDDDKKKEEQKPVDPATKRRRITIGIAVGVVVLVAGIAWWLYSRTYESTDDAQINGHLNAIASRVAGTVKAVYVENDQPVKAGQPLVDLDPSDYQVLVEQARAGYEQAIAQAAAEILTQSLDRFAAGVTNSVEVVQSQETVASAERDYVSTLFSLNLARISLARATGQAERFIPNMLKGN